MPKDFDQIYQDLVDIQKRVDEHNDAMVQAFEAGRATGDLKSEWLEFKNYRDDPNLTPDERAIVESIWNATKMLDKKPTEDNKQEFMDCIRQNKRKFTA